MISELLSYIFYPLVDSFGVGYFTAFMAFFVSLISTMLYVSLTPQSKIKKLKKEVEELNKELKFNIGNTDITTKIHKEITNKNMQIMPHIILPNMLTVAPMFFVFFWMGSMLSFIPIVPNETFVVDLYLMNNTNSSSFNPVLTLPNGLKFTNVANNDILYQYNLTGKTGNYTLSWNINNKDYKKNLTISNKQVAVIPMDIIQDNTVNAIGVEYRESKIPILFNFKVEWFVAYIILSICFTSILRKLLDVY